jgi:DMSO/TMAO reductase YedYZ molybdopterin-dependent catalytic subunit
MKNKINKILFLLVIVLSLVFISLFLKSQKYSSQVRQLKPVEVREYEGKNLSSIEDFRENSIKGPQNVDKKSYLLKIKGLSGGEKNYSYDDLLKNNQAYQKVVTLNCVEGWKVTILWEGFLAKDLAPQNEIPEGTNTVIFRAADGYSTSFPLSYIMDSDILMAYKMNGVELPPERGFPFQLVAEDKWGYKWIKWITEIEFSPNSDYEGYWESRGYSKSGNLNESRYGN